MGDWRTLHFFDKEKYEAEMVPLIRDTENYLSSFLNERRTRWLDSFPETSSELTNDLIAFVSELTGDLTIHPTFKASQERKEGESYNEYVTRSVEDYDNFQKSHSSVLEFYEFLLIETIFSSVAPFNPHFILGKRMFESCITAKENSIAEDLLDKIIFPELGSITDLIDGGIINLLSKDDIQLLIHDIDNIWATDDENVQYLNEFIAFVQHANKNNLGLIALRNPREGDLRNLTTIPNEHEEFMKSNNFKYIIIE